MKNQDSLSKICTTKSHEFVIFDSLCIAVRDRIKGVWLEEHFALDERVGLVPAPRTADRPAGWELVVYALAVQIWVGPVDVIDPAASSDAAASMPIVRAPRRRARLLAARP